MIGDVQRQLDRLRRRGSILDTFKQEAGRFHRTLGAQIVKGLINT